MAEEETPTDSVDRPNPHHIVPALCGTTMVHNHTILVDKLAATPPEKHRYGRRRALNLAVVELYSSLDAQGQVDKKIALTWRSETVSLRPQDLTAQVLARDPALIPFMILK